MAHQGGTSHGSIHYDAQGRPYYPPRQHNSQRDQPGPSPQREYESTDPRQPRHVQTGVTTVSHYAYAQGFVHENPVHLTIAGSYYANGHNPSMMGNSHPPSSNRNAEALRVEYHTGASNFRTIDPVFAEVAGDFEGPIDSFLPRNSNSGRADGRRYPPAPNNPTGIFPPDRAPPFQIYPIQPQQQQQSAYLGQPQGVPAYQPSSWAPSPGPSQANQYTGNYPTNPAGQSYIAAGPSSQGSQHYGAYIYNEGRPVNAPASAYPTHSHRPGTPDRLNGDHVERPTQILRRRPLLAEEKPPATQYRPETPDAD